MNHFNIRLSQKQKKRCKKIYKSEKGRPSERAHIILLYCEGYKINEIAKICLCDRNTVANTLKRFEEQGISGLYDKERSGCPSILNEEDEQYLFSCLEKCPSEFGYFAVVWTIGLMIHLLRTHKKKTISESALKELLHKRRWKFNRPKLIPPEPTPMPQAEKQEVLRLLINPQEDEIILFGDESDFELLPYIGGAWMPEGKQLKVPTPGTNQILCCFGFFNPHTKEFFYKLVISRKEKTAKNFIAVLHQMRYLFPGKKIHIVIDNASIHNEKTNLLKKFRETYQDVFIHFLPKKAPILNPIERFWQFLKKRIVCNWLYKSLEDIKAAFRRFIWQYREKFIQYNFRISKLISIWTQYPTTESISNVA